MWKGQKDNVRKFYFWYSNYMKGILDDNAPPSEVKEKEGAFTLEFIFSKQE